MVVVDALAIHAIHDNFGTQEHAAALNWDFVFGAVTPTTFGAVNSIFSTTSYPRTLGRICYVFMAFRLNEYRTILWSLDLLGNRRIYNAQRELFPSFNVSTRHLLTSANTLKPATK